MLLCCLAHVPLRLLACNSMARSQPKDRPVLILTAGMGAGHNGVASELQRRLEAAGQRVDVIDVLDVLPLWLGRLVKGFYSAMIRYAPWLYDLIYRFWFRPSPKTRGPVSPVTAPIQRHVSRWITEFEPPVVVSTFHLCTQVIGTLRQSGVLQAPAVSVIVDVAVHRLWIHPGIDHNLCFHPAAAAQALLQSHSPASAPGPVVRPAFTHPEWDRASARASLGLTEDEQVVLVVGGSWGVGQVQETASLLASSDHLVGMVVCGHNQRLYRQFRDQQGLMAFGWVEDMARLMMAADAVVDNAGGLTCMEALASGAPVVAFRPLPGHGRANIETMAAAGIVLHVQGANELVQALATVVHDSPERQQLQKAAASMFADDSARVIRSLADGVIVPRRPHLNQAPSLRLPWGSSSRVSPTRRRKGL